jgi:glycosyltransferase involved in cell wall biosynthesis
MAAFSAVDLSLPQGHALHLRGLFDALCGRGHTITLVTPRPKGTRPPVAFRTLDTPILRWRVLGPWSFEILGGLRLLLGCLGRRADLLYVRQDLYTFAPALVAKILGIPLAVEINSSIEEELALWGRPLVARIAGWCARFTLRRAAVILVLADEHGCSLATRVGVDASRFRTVPIGARLPASSDPVRTREEHRVAASTFLVGFAGNLAPIQGVDLLLDAFERLPASDVALWVIGTGTEEEALRRRAGALGSRVHFHGGVSREESDRLQQACQILVAPYRKDAYLRVSAGGTLSSKVLAYLANDRPVLITDLPGYGWIEEIGAGQRCASQDPLRLAEAISDWCGRWRASGRPLTRWPWSAPGPGRRYVEDGRTWDHAAARVEAVFSELVGTH